MKKLINNASNAVAEMLKGIAKAHPSVLYSGDDTRVISRKEKKQGKVGLVSGGGAGHEPAHAGYVGLGMLDAAVSGNVFASPGPDQILEGIRAANCGAGVLMIVKNYSGDIMNFEMAAELAEMEGIKVDSVVVKDDVAVMDSTYSTGRRGIAGTVFVHKIAGAAAEEGNPLEAIKAIAQKTIGNMRSMGVAITPCTIPGAKNSGFSIADDEIEIGMGIHGEPGITKEKISEAASIARKLVDKILEDYDYSGSEVAVMVNGLGGTPLMELYIMYHEVDKILREKGIGTYRSFVGNYMTSLEMAGCSVTLLKLDDNLKQYLDAPADTPTIKV